MSLSLGRPPGLQSANRDNWGSRTYYRGSQREELSERTPNITPLLTGFEGLWRYPGLFSLKSQPRIVRVVRLSFVQNIFIDGSFFSTIAEIAYPDFRASQLMW